MSLEEMGAFFDARVDGYEAHMLANVGGADEYYRVLARCLASMRAPRVLDLGCGTGLELDEIYLRFPDARVTGVDLAEKMLEKLAEKHKDRTPVLIAGDYLTADFGGDFDACVSAQTMHHFEHGDKLRLYRRIWDALRPGGVYVEADYVAATAEEEAQMLEAWRETAEARSARAGQYHFDIPMTIAHQCALLREAGFSKARLCWYKPNTAVFAAEKGETP